jgi:hypothetical protein
MQTLRIVVVGISLVLALLSASVSAQAQGRAPVAITQCTVLQFAPTPTYPFWRPFGPYPYESLYTDGIRIVYVNHAPQVANRVAFLVNYRGDIQRIIDVGTFSPNVSINHTFGEFTGDAWLGPKPNACRVVAVRFVDGSVWRAAAPARRRAAIP